MRNPLPWFLTAEVVSVVGSRVTFIALPWFVYASTGSAERTGLVAFAETLPYVLASLFGGPVIDRVGPRRVSVVADAASAVVLAAIPLLYSQEALNFAALAGLIAVAGALRGFGDTAKGGLFPAVVRTAGTDMARATTLHDGLNRAAGLLAIPAAGVLIYALGGAANLLLIDALTFALASAGIAALTRVATPEPEPQAYGAALRAGFAYLRGDRLVLGITVMVFATNLLDQANGVIFIPVWVHDVVGTPAALGLLGGAFGLGAVLGNLGYAALATRLPRYWTFALCFLLGGPARFLVLAATHRLVPVLIVTFCSGVLFSTVNPIMAATSYERIPAALQARVYGIISAICMAGLPLGGLLGGWAVAHLGLTTALVGTGTLYLAATLFPLVQPVWRQLDTKELQPTG